ncbi:SDR family oxidoreductase [Antrihabitans sp. YC2-6]|uniref:SDR family NAD(P)-dependent oxidoreductase n=1 Tax=Antrihabitans sp. YC2-6 TaxID=2799498 RepID=UPI0018F30553|nr:SDR family NAD(P)-dependent oxidoreductase [Antrihabitans sp. YC2-6]MBJ8344264.1 SDR family NAD(P)-dependent oxidoreductase [Antrihabitans sp. YC2-6]
MKQLNGKVAVVTGAGSGIGRALAIDLTKRGARVAISDVDAAGLAETAKICRTHGPSPHVQVLDVSNREDMTAYADTVAKFYGTVNLVINNAGITIFGTVEDSPYADVEKVMNVDFWGVVHGTKAFLPHLIASGDGHIVNISSVFGLFSVPTQSSYNAAKFAVRGYTESLRQEMLVAGHPVGVTCVHPGGIKTNIVRNATSSTGVEMEALRKLFEEKLTHTSPESAAQTILRGVTSSDSRVLIGLDAKAFDLIVRVLGPSYQRIFATASRFLLGAHVAPKVPAAKSPEAVSV